jgi:hypothetical protein
MPGESCLKKENFHAWKVFTNVGILPIQGGSLPTRGKTFLKQEDFPHMGSLPIYGKTAHIWEVFQCIGRRPIHGKSSQYRNVVGSVNRPTCSVKLRITTHVFVLLCCLFCSAYVSCCVYCLLCVVFVDVFYVVVCLGVVSCVCCAWCYLSYFWAV